MVTPLLALCLLMGGFEPVVVVDRVAVVETQHVYDCDGKHVFDQRIFWRWNKWECRYECQAWRLIKDPRNAPVGRTMTWVDSDGTIRRVVADSVRETWSQEDSETLDRQVVPQERRRELSKVNRGLLEEGR